MGTTVWRREKSVTWGSWTPITQTPAAPLTASWRMEWDAGMWEQEDIEGWRYGVGGGGVIRHLLQRQLLLQWYLQQQRVGVRVMIQFLVWGRVRIKIRIRVKVVVTYNVRVYHWSNCRRSNWHAFLGEWGRGKNASSGLWTLATRPVHTSIKLQAEERNEMQVCGELEEIEEWGHLV